MQKLMTQSYRNYIKNRIQEENEEIKKRIMNLNIKNFVEDYKTVLNDHDFINYIINLIGRNLKLFFNDNNISNRSLNFIINSSIMKNIINFINDHKKNLKKLIVDIINKNSIDFINKQANLEKFHKSNIETKNKRSLEGFKKTSKIFLKKNFYYTCQKYIIKEILNYCQKKNGYLDEYIKNFEASIDDLINNNKNISLMIENFFYEKLKQLNHFKDFKEDKINNNESNKESNCNNLNLIKDEILDLDESFLNNNKSFEYLNIIEKLEYEKKNNISNLINIVKTKVFTLEKKSKYFDDNLSKKLYNFLFELNFQENSTLSFLIDDSDLILIELINYIQKDLEIFCENNFYEFINSLNEYQKKLFTKDTLDNISKSIESNNEGNFIYGEDELKKKFINLKLDKSFCKIDYITIILSGKSGVGKSTLINALLKENLALESIPKVGTQKIASYQNKKITFLKMIDTRGVELIKKYGNENISNDINKVIDNPNTLNYFSFTNKQSYNDNIQCLWYCVNKKKLEEQDIEMLSKFKKNQDQLPIIIVFTKAKDQELVEKMRKCVKEKLGDLPFHDLIAKDFDNVDTSYGLEDLIFLTLEQCKLAVKGDIFNDIKKIIYDTIEMIPKKIMES